MNRKLISLDSNMKTAADNSSIACVNERGVTIRIPRPGGIATAADGAIYITESNGPWIHKIHSNGLHEANWLAKDAPDTVARATYGLTIHQGFLYLAYSNTGKVVRIHLDHPAGGEETVISGIMGAFGLVVYEEGLYISSYYHGRVMKVPVTATGLVYKSTEHDYCRVPGARGIAFDSKGALYIASYSTGIVFRYTRKGPATAALTGLPAYLTGLCINAADELYVSFNATTEGLRKYTANLESYTTPLSLRPVSINTMIWTLALTPSGHLLAGDYNTGEIYRLLSHRAATPPPARHRFNWGVRPAYTPELSSLHVASADDQEQLLLWR